VYLLLYKGDSSPPYTETMEGKSFMTGSKFILRLLLSVFMAVQLPSIGKEVPLADADPVLVGAGDISSCLFPQDEATANLLDGIAGTVFTAGDNAYDIGSAAEFASCYAPTWGRAKARTKPAPGNHEYYTPGASGYYSYFGPAAGDPAKGYYSYNLGTWHIIVLNSEVDVAAGSAQESWLRVDLTANPAVCTLAIWHKPRFSSGTSHGSDPGMQPLWQALHDFHADVVVNGHEHNYERFAPQSPGGVADATGIREFVVGTGGMIQNGFGNILPNSEVRNSGDYGVIKFTLHAGSYDWQFVPVSGQTFTDSGSAPCVGSLYNNSDTVGVFRPGNGLLYLKNTSATGFADAALNYGLPGDYPVVGDWDGNGTVTIGVYRDGSFYLRNSNTIGFAEVVFPFGQPGDQPIAGDWNGDGIDTIGVYRPSIGQFLLRNINTEGSPTMSFYLGNPGDVGIAGDWDGDGVDTTGVFRPSNGVIFLKNKNSTGIADIALNYGLPGDRPVMGDWDNDGKDTIGIYRAGTFYLRNENTNGFAELVFSLGNPGDIPIAGNWDGKP
jgi:hypothetical protein